MHLRGVATPMINANKPYHHYINYVEIVKYLCDYWCDKG